MPFETTSGDRYAQRTIRGLARRFPFSEITVTGCAADSHAAEFLGLPGVRIYQLCGTSAYHDVTLGSNGAYPATSGYDMSTGVGTIDTDSFLSAY